MTGDFPKEWYWLAALLLFFVEREVILDICFAIIELIFMLLQ